MSNVSGGDGSGNAGGGTGNTVASHGQESSKPQPVITEEQRQKFRRRVLNAPVTARESRFSRRLDLLNLVLSFAGGAYVMLYADFGEREHLFTPVQTPSFAGLFCDGLHVQQQLRQWYFGKVNKLTELDTADVEELKRQGKL
ncbi:hypothetical protein RI367_004162 [Sorochytrium milnesiophthora]